MPHVWGLYVYRTIETPILALEIGTQSFIFVALICFVQHSAFQLQVDMPACRYILNAMLCKYSYINSTLAT